MYKILQYIQDELHLSKLLKNSEIFKIEYL